MKHGTMNHMRNKTSYFFYVNETLFNVKYSIQSRKQCRILNILICIFDSEKFISMLQMLPYPQSQKSLT